MSQLHAAVARAIAEVYANRSWEATAGARDAEAAAAAIRVVFAEAERSIEALPLPPAQGYGGQTMRLRVLAALEELGEAAA